MTLPQRAEVLSPRRKLGLQRAHDFLERPDFAARLAQYVGRPVDRALRMAPSKFNDRPNKAVENAILAGLGALGGAGVNALFMQHFQRVAHAHFTVRRLERLCGVEAVRSYFQTLEVDRLADELRSPPSR